MQQLFAQDATLLLLRADLAPVALASLAQHLGGDVRRMDSHELYEAVDADLDLLRSAGQTLPGTAQSYVTKWRDQGILIRRPSEDAAGETYELSGQALAAIRFVQGLEAPRQSATESRLDALGRQLSFLVVDTDPSTQRRIARLEDEKRRLEKQIAAIKRGEDDPLSEERAAERLRDLLDQAAAVPDDFARIRAEFEALNLTLRETILDADTSQGTVLDDIFRGVDLIADSDAGRTFRAFRDLVMDPAQGGAFEDDVDQILERAFAGDFSLADRQLLRGFMANLKAQTAEVQQATTQFARGLRRYVQSQDYQQDKALRGLIRGALQAGLQAAEHVKPYEAIGANLPLTGVSLSSIGAWRPHDPGEFAATEAVVVNQTGDADLEQLRQIARATDIDFGELIGNINLVLETQEEATVGDVLTRHPSTQGLASVVGLLVLAAEWGRQDEGAHEDLFWAGTDGVPRRATVAQHRFTGPVM